MNFEFSLFPGLGGYWLVTNLNVTRSDMLRRSGYHVAFLSAFWGFMLLIPAYAIAVCIDDSYPTFVPDIRERAAILSVLLGIVLPAPLNNLFFSQRDAEKKVAEKHGGLIELLIVESIERGKLVEVSLKGDKAYIGFALANRVARWTGSHMSMLPVSSGYRDKDTRELVITTNYASVIAKHIENMGKSAERPAVELRDFRVVIPRSEIISARLFDPDLHQQFQATGN